MNYETVALGDVCEFLDNQRVPITESDRKPGPYPYYGANGQQDSIDNYIFDEPLVLLAEDGGYFGSKDRPIAYKVTGKCWVNNHAHVLRPKSDIDVDYLHRVLSYYDVTKYVNGTTRQKLTKGNAENISFPLPPLTEQKRIASLLARADRLRQLRRTAHDLSASVLQSVFLEMFGDPVTNSKKLNVEKLEGFTNLVSSGSTPLGGSNVYTASGIRFIRSQNVLMNKFDFSDIAFISEEIYNSMKRTFVKRNDVLLNITGASIGRVACYQDDILANVNQHVCIIRCKPEKLNPIYLSYFLSMPSFQEKFITNQSGATRQALNFEQIKDFNISVPPLSKQEEFAGVVARVESLRGRMGESERQVEGLFESLLAQSFETE
jgi:type I restriction enzyme S subunit